ncbi:MAG: peptidoglycan editing factor PgeF, partial [Rhodobacteraceae bacterium]|nr:peptidoglycan editing factor PgeF [Paracoccaceae bacterium]
IIFMKQVHSNHVQLVQTRPVKPLEADGMVTDKPGLVLGILTADCQPIILTDPVTKIVAAVHAGWKGTLNGIIHTTLSIMISLGAAKENIRGAIGPAISQDHYEFGGDLREKFIQRYPYANQYFRPTQSDRFYFDLTGITLNIFAEAGIHKIERLDLCTYANEGLFFSYRRSCHHHENQFGLNGSIIAT